ncbi:MAG: lipoyl(octanoyl) transferase LipB [Candidatus Eisenbacteria bacterium]|uniref:Octanoyltransferase n=1 Tax=Eiseniibacteriota bacterium TaxID=2212470 RepID=A0A956LZE2_UNCEI|nr:lipoyl(octanoyl) transferase LipB [Candidatus Eisenbacteria bacterium]
MPRDWPTTSASRSEADQPLWVVSFAEPQPYRRMWEWQRQLWRARWQGEIPDVLLLLEHDPVITLGRNARREHVLVSSDELARRNTELIAVDRGGDVTYHGPGQLVGYWIFDLRCWHQDVHRFLRTMEQGIIDTLAELGLAAQRSEGATGVWVDDAKVAAIGLHLSHWVSTHGFAFNLDLDLTPFSWIVPCGLRGRPVTSVGALRGSSPPRLDIEDMIVRHSTKGFGRSPIRKTWEDLESALAHGQACEGAAFAKTMGVPCQ